MLFILLIAISFLAVIKAVEAIISEQKEHQLNQDDWEKTKRELDQFEEDRRNTDF